MAYYCISFRIADQTALGKSYDERRKALIEAAYDQKRGFWDSTTSFILIESSLDTVNFAKSVCASLSPQHDMAVVFDPSDMSMCYFGQVNEANILESFFKISQKI
ncbi:hypothetical protein [Agrobacterium vitis]|uniref:Uncharacterized protein n=1 Tax=Agrobacterium vitis TaxID=373 RepID=A0AAE2RGC9_AGRVI|nr:hypothetical protein [Agrobacterium vitis]MBF2716879.1 hypothetical protein [Agrobacterium vitis]